MIIKAKANLVKDALGDEAGVLEMDLGGFSDLRIWKEDVCVLLDGLAAAAEVVLLHLDVRNFVLEHCFQTRMEKSDHLSHLAGSLGHLLRIFLTGHHGPEPRLNDPIQNIGGRTRMKLSYRPRATWTNNNNSQQLLTSLR